MASDRLDGGTRALVVVAAVAALAFGARRLHPGSGPGAGPAASAKPAAAATAPVAARPALATATAPLVAARPDSAVPGSLQGTDEDGALRVDDRGELVVGPEILAFFDYHLSATGELTPQAIRARILARIQAELPAHAAAEATTLLDRYLAYREATRTLRDDGDSRSRLDALHRLRQRIFGDEDAARLFGDQERSDAVALAGQQIQQDPSLSAEERARRLAQLEETLPEAVRAARARATLPLRELEEEAARRTAGADDAEIRSYRVATVGSAAADRLEALDARRAEWTRRLVAFQAARAKIEREASDPAAARVTVAALLEASFSPEERLRVAALDTRTGQTGQTATAEPSGN